MKEINDNETIGLKSIIVKYLLQWKLFLLAFVISIILAFLYLMLYPCTFEMSATVQVQEDYDSGGAGLNMGDAAGIMRSFGLGSLGGGDINIDDELTIINSNQFFRDVISELGLNVEYSYPFTPIYQPYNTSEIVVTTDAVTEALLSAGVSFEIRIKNGKIKVKTLTLSSGDKKHEFSSLPAEIVIPEGRFILSYRNENNKPDNFKINADYLPFSHAAEKMLGSILVEEYSKRTNAITFSYKDHEKSRGLDILNTAIKHYNSRTYDHKKTKMTKILGYYDARIDSTVTELLSIEHIIENYKAKNKLTDIYSDILFYSEQMKQIQIKNMELGAQSHAISLMSEFINAPENKYNLVPVLMSMEGGDNSGSITLYNEVLLQRLQTINNSSIDNPVVASWSLRADNLRESVRNTINNAKKTIDLSIKDLEEKEKLILNEMRSYPEQERQFIDLKRKQEILQGMYLILLQKREEAVLAIGNNQDRAYVIETPFIKKKSIAPRKLYAAIGMMFFTLIIPVIFIFCKEQYISLRDEVKKTVKNNKSAGVA